MAQILKFKDRSEWLDARKGGIGASEVGTILGINPFSTPYQLWRLKMGIDPPKEENFAMRAGHYLEDAVARFYADETGAHIIQASAEDFMYVSKDKPFMRVSPDRTYWEQGVRKSEANKRILECKTTQRSVTEDSVPQHWFVQLQMNLGVSGKELGALAWLIQGREFGFKHYALDREFFAFLEEQVEKFWTDNIIGGQEPLPYTVDDVMLKYPRHIEGKCIQAGEDILRNVERLKEVRDELKRFNDEKDSLEDSLKMSMLDAELLMDGDRIVATWKTAKDSQKFNAKRFTAENPELAKAYIETTAGSRRFALK